MLDLLAHQSHTRSAILTFHSDGRVWDQVIDIHVLEDGVTEWGYQKHYQSIVAAKLINPETYPLSVVVRTFTEREFPCVLKTGKEITLPGKQIRMFFLPSYGKIIQLSKEDCFACMNTDARTGNVLPLDPTLEYMGPE